MLFKLKDRLRRARHAALCRSVWSTPPVRSRPGPVPLVFLSQIRRGDLLMYIAAIKTIATRIGFGQIIQIDDNSMTREDLALLQTHLPGSRCIPIADVETWSCPRGGTWERLCKILELAADAYVVQVDADTLVRDEISEVTEAIAANRSFTLGTTQGTEFVGMQDAVDFVRDADEAHIQIAVEKRLAQLPDAKALRYVRGSSGFAGFARGGFAPERLVAFSDWMSRAVGPRWSEWGTEQISSNFAVANTPGSFVLPYPKYTCFELDTDVERAAFLHFIGTNRFDLGVYARETRAAVKRLTGR